MSIPTLSARPRQTTRGAPIDYERGERQHEGEYRRTGPLDVCAQDLPRRRPDQSPESQDSVRTTEECLESLYQQQSGLLGVLQAPKVEVPTFNGDPMKYFPIIHAFEERVEKLLPDNGSRLAQLTQLCTGDAARAIQCCSLLPPYCGYPKARELLVERFGDHFTITELWVEKLVEGDRAWT